MVYTSIIPVALSVPISFISNNEKLKILAHTIFSGAICRFFSNRVSSENCIEYFTVGHLWDTQKTRFRPIQSLNPITTAWVWACIQTWHINTLAGSLFALIARTPFHQSLRKLSSTQIFPLILCNDILIQVFASKYARDASVEMHKTPYKKFYGVPLNKQAQWEESHVRNKTASSHKRFSITLVSLTILASRYF